MSLSDAVRDELQTLARAYLSGAGSIESILTFEVEHCDLDLDIDDELRRQLSWLSLRGHEYLMDLRPLEDFEEIIREVLSDSAPSASADAAGG